MTMSKDPYVHPMELLPKTTQQGENDMNDMNDQLDPRDMVARIAKLEKEREQHTAAIDQLANAVLNNSRELVRCQEALKSVLEQLVASRAIPKWIDGKVVHDA